jgi:ribosome biogenesis protein Tsr3
MPLIPDPLTWGDSLELNERLLNALEQCNHDKAAIRKIERIKFASKMQELEDNLSQ